MLATFYKQFFIKKIPRWHFLIGSEVYFLFITIIDAWILFLSYVVQLPSAFYDKKWMFAGQNEEMIGTSQVHWKRFDRPELLK